MFTFRFIASAGVVAFSTALCSSASGQTPVPFDAAKSQTLKRIDVLDVSEPAELVVPGRLAPVPTPADSKVAGALRHHVQGVAGDIGVNAAASAKLKAGMVQRNMSLSSEMARQVVAALKGSGYDVRLLKGQQLRMNNRGGIDASGIKSDADAVLEIQIRTAGYLPHRGGPDMLPTVSVDAMLVSTRDQTVLYRQLMSAGASLGPTGAADYLPVPTAPKYASRAAVAADADAAVDGLRDAAAAVADRIAAQLTR